VGLIHDTYDVHYVSLFTYKHYIMYMCIILYMYIIT